MEKNEIKKALYREKPIASRSRTFGPVRIDGVIVAVYRAKTSLGEHTFYIPESEMKDADGKVIFSGKEPAQLLIRWLI